MKKYILIQNDGEIETNSFELIGASTKRGETGKIGFFGSGLKYSIAYMMRKGIEFKVFSGEKELIFSTIPEQLKDQSFDRICINGKPTSYTVTMGPTWTEDWFVLREVYCNAIDEGTCQLVKETEIVKPSVGKTRIYIELTDVLRQVSANWDNYFSDERTPLFTAKDVYTCYLGHEDIPNATSSQEVYVFPKTEGVLFRRGIRVYTDKHWAYDYGCKNVNINEDRTAKHSTALAYGFAHMAAHISNEDWLKTILRTSKQENPCVELETLGTNGSDGGASNEWVRFSQENLLVVEEIAGRYSEQISMSKKELFLLPTSFARRIKKNVPDAKILGMDNHIGDTFSDEVEMTPKMKFLLKEVLASLKEMKYEVTLDISVVDFDDEKVLGQADTKEKKIYLASKLFDMGRREIAMTIMEEVEHISSGKEDETRAFQTHIFSQWLKSMENSNGLFL